MSKKKSQPLPLGFWVIFMLIFCFPIGFIMLILYAGRKK